MTDTSNFLQALRENGWVIQPDPFLEADAFLVQFQNCEGAATLRLVFQDYSGADLVITNMTVLPYDRTGKGVGSRALNNMLQEAGRYGLVDIRAVQVQSERFWMKNGFEKLPEPNPCNDFAYKGFTRCT